MSESPVINVVIPSAHVAAAQAHTMQQTRTIRQHVRNIKTAKDIAHMIDMAIQKGEFSVPIDYRPNAEILAWLKSNGYKLISAPRGMNEEHFRISFEHAGPAGSAVL